MTFVRRVVTGHDASGRAVFVSDGEPPKTVDRGGAGVSEVFVLDGPPTHADAGGDSPDPSFPLEPPPGGATVRIIRLPPPPADATDDVRWLHVPGEPADRPGWHTTDTLDFEVILDGEIVLDLDDGEHHLRTGDTVVQRGTAHRWRVVGDRPCTYAAIMLRPEATGGPTVPIAARAADSPSSPGPRRLVTGADADGRSRAELDGPPPVTLGASDTLLAGVWQTGGPLATTEQGGDADGGWQLEPLGHGAAFLTVQLAPGSDHGEAGWHVTDTIDVDIVLSGAVELALPDVAPVRLTHGDVVVQRGTNHLWRQAGDEPFRMAAVMFALRH